MFDSKQQDDVTVLATEAVDAAIEATRPRGKKQFHKWEDVGKYMKRTGKHPVVRKRKADSGEAKDDYFELVKAFPTLDDAREFCSGHLNYLIWYVPKDPEAEMAVYEANIAKRDGPFGRFWDIDNLGRWTN